jgi:hypothetical protein
MNDWRATVKWNFRKYISRENLGMGMNETLFICKLATVLSWEYWLIIPTLVVRLPVTVAHDGHVPPGVQLTGVQRPGS